MPTLTPFEDTVRPMMEQLRARHAEGAPPDPVEALAIEALQGMMEPCLRSMNRARDRGQDPGEIAEAYTRAFASLISTLAASLAGTKGPLGVTVLRLILRNIEAIALDGFANADVAMSVTVHHAEPMGRA